MNFFFRKSTKFWTDLIVIRKNAFRMFLYSFYCHLYNQSLSFVIGCEVERTGSNKEVFLGKKGRAQNRWRFFLSFVNPHKGVTSRTIGRWLKTVFNLEQAQKDMLKWALNKEGRALAERGLLATFRILLCNIREFYKRVKWILNKF